MCLLHIIYRKKEEDRIYKRIVRRKELFSTLKNSCHDNLCNIMYFMVRLIRTEIFYPEVIWPSVGLKLRETGKSIRFSWVKDQWVQNFFRIFIVQWKDSNFLIFCFIINYKYRLGRRRLKVTVLKVF